MVQASNCLYCRAGCGSKGTGAQALSDGGSRFMGRAAWPAYQVWIPLLTSHRVIRNCHLSSPETSVLLRKGSEDNKRERKSGKDRWRRKV